MTPPKSGDIDILIFSRKDPLRLSPKVATRFFMPSKTLILDDERKHVAYGRAILKRPAARSCSRNSNGNRTCSP